MFYSWNALWCILIRLIRSLNSFTKIFLEIYFYRHSPKKNLHFVQLQMSQNSRFIHPSIYSFIHPSMSVCTPTHHLSITLFIHLSVHTSINTSFPPSILTLTWKVTSLLHLLRWILRTWGRTMMTPYWVSMKLPSRGTLFTTVWRTRGGITNQTSLHLTIKNLHIIKRSHQCVWMFQHIYYEPFIFHRNVSSAYNLSNHPISFFRLISFFPGSHWFQFIWIKNNLQRLETFSIEIVHNSQYLGRFNFLRKILYHHSHNAAGNGNSSVE